MIPIQKTEYRKATESLVIDDSFEARLRITHAQKKTRNCHDLCPLTLHFLSGCCTAAVARSSLEAIFHTVGLTLLLTGWLATHPPNTNHPRKPASTTGGNQRAPAHGPRSRAAALSAADNKHKGETRRLSEICSRPQTMKIW